MAKKKIVLPAVHIHGIADRGKGVGRLPDGLVVFVDGAVPGDVVDVFVQKKKKEFAEGVVERIVTPSPRRVEPFCEHFKICGGCKWQYLAYEDQLMHKQQTVEDAMRRIAKVEIGEFLPILGAPETTFYRNKLEFGFSNRRWLFAEEMTAEGAPPDEDLGGLGFHKAGYFDKIIDIRKCWLQADPSNAVRNAAREIAREQGLEFYDLRRHTGFLRNLMLRLTTTGELMVLVSFAQDRPEAIKAFLDALIARFPTEITTVVYCINTKLNDSVFDQEMITYMGKGHAEEQLGELRFKIGPKSFFQTNSRQGKVLYDVAAEFAGLTGSENVYDLYTGTGSIALYLAHLCRQVVGIEEIPEAIADAEENRTLNGIDNAIFYAGDVKNVLSPEFIQRHGRPDVVVTDPPRAGMHEKALRFLLDLAAPRIVYVSCNPATQARDLALLAEKYRVLKMRPVDMFPHTHHIENVALLELIG
ncbi:MAG: 23S rRNA (uracil(1939)-C(5))-methyltransferase RlmD [Saprospiraceae bacterium]|nr:23S rRNA (uracil(1939)-C(5))-methyltransferase RlmD [Saprospiraceae bacterium]